MWLRQAGEGEVGSGSPDARTRDAARRPSPPWPVHPRGGRPLRGPANHMGRLGSRSDGTAGGPARRGAVRARTEPAARRPGCRAAWGGAGGGPPPTEPDRASSWCSRRPAGPGRGRSRASLGGAVACGATTAAADRTGGGRGLASPRRRSRPCPAARGRSGRSRPRAGLGHRERRAHPVGGGRADAGSPRLGRTRADLAPAAHERTAAGRGASRCRRTPPPCASGS